MKKLLVKVVSYALVLLLLINYTGCSREYSFEKSPPTSLDSLPPVVSMTSDLPFCSSCSSFPDPLNLNQWSLKVGQSVACGSVDTAIINLERNAFTFFGPSACSRDTGIVMTVYIENDALNHDVSNLAINRVAFYYYDRVTPSYIYISQHNSVFSVHIDTYKNQTGILIGNFSGNVFKVNGMPAFITGGKFKVKLR